MNWYNLYTLLWPRNRSTWNVKQLVLGNKTIKDNETKAKDNTKQTIDCRTKWWQMQQRNGQLLVDTEYVRSGHSQAYLIYPQVSVITSKR